MFHLIRTVNNERGVALIMTIFVISLASILVLNFAHQTFQYQKATRSYCERIQADYIIKSGFNLAQALIELPKEPGVQADWLGEPWALIAAQPSLPIGKLGGETRIMVVDESGKININSIIQYGIGSSSRGNTGNNSINPMNPFANSHDSSHPLEGMDPISNAFKTALAELFTRRGFSREQYSANESRTLGSTAFGPKEQVAVIHDWLDSDNKAHNNSEFQADGIESSSNKWWFYNKRMDSISELAMVPGMTLERVARIAPFVRAAPSGNIKVNVNTALPEVLIALGFSEQDMMKIIEERQKEPYSAALLANEVEGNDFLKRVTGITSDSFSVYVQVKLANVTRFAKALVRVNSGYGHQAGSRQTTVSSVEFL